MLSVFKSTFFAFNVTFTVLTHAGLSRLRTCVLLEEWITSYHNRIIPRLKPFDFCGKTNKQKIILVIVLQILLRCRAALEVTKLKLINGQGSASWLSKSYTHLNVLTVSNFTPNVTKIYG